MADLTKLMLQNYTGTTFQTGGHKPEKGVKLENPETPIPDIIALRPRVAKQEPRAIIREAEIVKGDRSLNGYRSYWLVENGEIIKSVAALTDEDAEKLLNESRET